MAEIVKALRTRQIEGVDCQICGFAWKPHDLCRLPRRCSNPECRSMRWDRSRYPNAASPPPSGGPGGGLHVAYDGQGLSITDGSVPVIGPKKTPSRVPAPEQPQPQHTGNLPLFDGADLREPVAA